MGHDPQTAELRFSAIFAHLGAIMAYARRRGSADAAAIAAETMTVAWRRLDKVPADDPLPWLYATARNLVWAEARSRNRSAAADAEPAAVPPPELFELDPAMADALRALAPIEREALLLVAWEELTPAQAAKALGISGPAFRVRLLRARRRVRALLADDPAQSPLLEMETST